MTCPKGKHPPRIKESLLTLVCLLICGSVTTAHQSKQAAAGQHLLSEDQQPLVPDSISGGSSDPSTRHTREYTRTRVASNAGSKSSDQSPTSHITRTNIDAPHTDREDTQSPTSNRDPVFGRLRIGATAIRSPEDPVSAHENADPRQDGHYEGGSRRDMLLGIGGVMSREVSSGQASITDDQTIGELFDSPGEGDASERSSSEQETAEPDLYSGSGDRSAFLEDMVRSLQSQVEESQTSQARTRSILNVIQEKQAEQDRDIAMLKDELQVLKTVQTNDHSTLEEVRIMVSDSAWAISDLKHSQDQLHADFSTFKKFQEQQNETVRELEEHIDIAKEHRYGYRDLITRLHIEVERVKEAMGRDRETMVRLKNMLTSLDRANREMATKHEHLNKIPTLVSSESGESSGGDAFNSDHIYSAQEEVDNSIGQNLVELYKHKHHMHMQIENLNKRFLHYDAEMAKLHATYFNLSLQITSVENKVLSRQHNQFDSDMTKLQSSFINFTQQMFNLEKWHMTTKSQLNTSFQNEMEINQLKSSVEANHQSIQALENIAVEYREEANLRRIYQDQLMSMNHSVQAMRLRLRDHKTKATHNFDDVDEDVTTIRSDIKKHHKRLLEIEVRVLNESLYQCRKKNDDSMQDMKLDKLRSEMIRVDSQLVDHTSHLTRHDRSLSGMYNEVKGNNRMIGEVMSQSKILFDLVPRTNTLEDEIRNLLQHLPKDCSEVHQSEGTQSGLHLIRPEGSIGSIRAYCEYDQGGKPWLVIQRRETGTESFARSWEEYKAGFGSPEKEFWIGNSNLNALTIQKQYRLRIDLWDLNDVYYFVEYDFFRVEDESTSFRLNIDGYHGNATDAMRYSNFMPFSTMDRDNDVSSTHCAKFYTAGWWYKHCHYSNLNGRYTVGIVWFNHDFDEWVQLKKTVMKMQPVVANGTDVKQPS